MPPDPGSPGRPTAAGRRLTPFQSCQTGTDKQEPREGLRGPCLEQGGDCKSQKSWPVQTEAQRMPGWAGPGRPGCGGTPEAT